jgi:hypothetical protein
VIVLNWLRKRLTYSNIVATLALFIALGGTSYAVLRVGSAQLVNNSVRSVDLRDDRVRSRDVRNRTIRARDVRRDGLGAGVVKEQALGTIPHAANADRLGGTSASELRVRCPADTMAKAGVCIESAPRPPDGFLGATTICDNAGRGLPTMPQLDRMARSRGPLSPLGEWSASVYANPAPGQPEGPIFDELETLVVSGSGDVRRERVFVPVQHPFRCVALPAN